MDKSPKKIRIPRSVSAVISELNPNYHKAFTTFSNKPSNLIISPKQFGNNIINST